MANPLIPMGAQRRAPGIYELDGALHVDAIELCAEFGVPPTPKNLNEICNGILEAAVDVGVRYREVGP